ncbi:MAG: hypothetical protein AB1736_14495 [Chloroflexota bacterium]
MPDPVTSAAAVAFLVVTTAAVGFQLALAAGAPWGAYAFGGAFPGRFPTRLRIAAVGQAILLASIGAIVGSRAGLFEFPALAALPSLIWLVVAFSAVSLAFNAISRSPGERRLWVPVAVVMLLSSLVVATGSS